MRLKLGEMAQATVFNDDPAAQARAFAAQGFRMPAHRRSQRRLRRQAGQRAPRSRRSSPRSPSRCSSAAASATSPPSRRGSAKASRRVILGTVAVRDPGLVREACRRFPGRIAVGIDAKGGKVAVEGWARGERADGHRAGAPLRGRRRRRHHLHRHRARRRAEGAQSAGDGRAGARHLHPRHRLGRPRRHRRHRGAAAPRIRMLEGAIAGRALYDGRLDRRGRAGADYRASSP